MKYPMIVLSRYPEWMEKAAAWFHEKWGIPKETYLKSMEESLNGKTIPQWYIVVDRKQIVAGIGVIENDFHERKDLAPNVCAVLCRKSVSQSGDCRSNAGFRRGRYGFKGNRNIVFADRPYFVLRKIRLEISDDSQKRRRRRFQTLCAFTDGKKRGVLGIEIVLMS